jgi:hypothetical protein
MYEPEESDESTSPAMGRVLDELEAEFEAGLRREAEQEAMAAVRAEMGATVLWEQLARRIGSDARVSAGTRAFRGGVVASYPEFLVLRAADGADHLIRYGPTVSIGLPAEPRALRPAPPAACADTSSRWPSASSPVDASRSGSNWWTGPGDGTIEAVGSDYLEVAEHDLGEARRRVAVRARRFVGFAAVVAVTLPPGRR